MRSRLWWKLIVTVAVLVWASSELFPLKDRPFGPYLKQRVQADPQAFDAILEQAHAQVASQQAPSLFVAIRSIADNDKIDLSQFFPEYDLADVKNVSQRNDILLNHLLQSSLSHLKLGLDLEGGVAFTLKVDEQALRGSSDAENSARFEKAVDIMHNRVNGLGVSEPVIRVVGNDRIEVQLPGVTTQENPDALSALQKPAKLTFHRVYRGASVLPNGDPVVAPGYMPMSEEFVDPRTGEVHLSTLLVKRVPDLAGDAIDSAFASMADAGGYQINLNFTPQGAERFRELTALIASENDSESYRNLPENAPGRHGRLAIVLDGKLYSSPRVTEAIAGGHARITGNFSQREALELSNVLNNPLEFALTVDQMYEVGPSLAEDARDASINASILGVALVALFMIGYYGLSGSVAMVAVAFNILMTLGAMAMLGATLTLPGVAALVLNVGMAVDAHILIFERMREELRLGKSLKTALAAGHERALSTIVDSNLTTLLVGVILIYFGTGPVKGFGVTLSLGILATLFSALIVSHFLLEVLVNWGLIRSMPSFALFKESKIDFMNWRRKAFMIMGAIIVLGGVSVGMRGRDILGIDFRGGDEMTLAFHEKIPVAVIHKAAEAGHYGQVAPFYQGQLGDASEKLKIQTESGQGATFVNYLQKKYPQSDLRLIGETQIGAVVSKTIQANVGWSLLAALIGILIYVAFRFQVGYGVGAAVSTGLDVLVSIGIFSLCSGQFTASMVAAVLMIVGYSINDKIVVFDRIREELVLNPTMSLLNVINLAVNRTLSRTTLTSLTTFLASLSLYIFGEGEIRDFAFLFMLGIITGTLSSIFVASPIFFLWHKGDRRHIEAKEALPTYDWDASS